MAIAACQLVSTALAQSASSAISLQVVTRTASATRPSASSRPQDYRIKVGSGGFVFDPPELKNVSVGSTVTFEFYPPDHSVIQAEFGSACVPYSYADSEHQGKGFWTPLQYVDFSNVSNNLVFIPHEPLPSSYFINLCRLYITSHQSFPLHSRTQYLTRSR